MLKVLKKMDEWSESPAFFCFVVVALMQTELNVDCWHETFNLKLNSNEHVWNITAAVVVVDEGVLEFIRLGLGLRVFLSTVGNHSGCTCRTELLHGKRKLNMKQSEKILLPKVWKTFRSEKKIWSPWMIILWIPRSSGSLPPLSPLYK